MKSKTTTPAQRRRKQAEQRAEKLCGRYSGGDFDMLADEIERLLKRIERAERETEKAYQLGYEASQALLKQGQKLSFAQVMERMGIKA